MNDIEQFLSELGIELEGGFKDLDETILFEAEGQEDTTNNVQEDDYISDLLRQYNPNYQPGRKQTYVIDLKDSKEFGKVFSRLDKSDLVVEDSESSQVTDDNTSIQYISDRYTLTLLGDFDSDIYKLTIREN